MSIRIALAQIDATVGDLAGNRRKILDRVREAAAGGADIVTFPELALTGYPPEDLLLKTVFIEATRRELEKLIGDIPTIVCVVGFVDAADNRLFNAAAVIKDGRLLDVCHKILLPNYGVFDEKRYFTPGSKPMTVAINGAVVGINICEDIWHPTGPMAAQVKNGAVCIVNINASPYHRGKGKEREAVLRGICTTYHVPVAYTNMTGGQDELVFDGQSMVMNADGALIARAPAFEETLLICDVPVAVANKSDHPRKRPSLPAPTVTPALPLEQEVYHALVTGLRDYVKKNGFGKVLVGLSGGIDSALVAVIAADALGKENVVTVFMPSRYSSGDSRNDAELMAKSLGVKFIVIPIEEPFTAFLSILKEPFAGAAQNVAEENLQARIRGNILMALSNKFGWLVLTTGNKSEMSTGYATLYGDMAGGFAVIKDVYKTLVYQIARYRNTVGNVIPERIFSKAPTAELRHNQKDSDTLPPYEILDKILKLSIEEDRSPDEIAAAGFDRALIRKVLRMVDTSEYKRRQAPPGIKITPKAFGRDRRMPITNKYRKEM